MNVFLPVLHMVYYFKTRLADLKIKVNPRNIEAKSIYCYIFFRYINFDAFVKSKSMPS